MKYEIGPAHGRAERRLVQEIGLDQLELRMRERVSQEFSFTSGEVVVRDDLVAPREQAIHEVTSDETCSPRNECLQDTSKNRACALGARA
jgi:hypothetical protein